MKNSKRDKLLAKGYRLTSAEKFLNLSSEEIAIIDLKISLIMKLRELRNANGMTQAELAKLMKTSQSRVAMLESGNSDASLELICKALFLLGISPKQLGKTIASMAKAA